jgi:4-amino-4-deoxy-L-arabinose transferase-like glycosyltransferase
VKISSNFLLFVALFLTINLLLRNHQVSLWEEDEAAYMGFALQMLETGDWVEPGYQWSTIHRKTPLHIWTIALSFSCFGYNEFALRLPAVLAVLCCIFVLYRFSIPIWGSNVAKTAAIILACSIQLPLMGKIAFTDATLLLFETIALLALVNYLHRPHWKWNLALWLAMAAGILTKGPPIVLIVGGLWVLLAIFHPLRKNLIGTHPWIWAWLAVAPFGFWCYLSYQQDYTSWQQSGRIEPFEIWWNTTLYGKKIHLLPFLWDWYVIQRINGHVLGQSGFIGYHLLVLTVAFLLGCLFG